jgi:hypothetical protein
MLLLHHQQRYRFFLFLLFHRAIRGTGLGGCGFELGRFGFGAIAVGHLLSSSVLSLGWHQRRRLWRARSEFPFEGRAMREWQTRDRGSFRC